MDSNLNITPAQAAAMNVAAHDQGYEEGYADGQQSVIEALDELAGENVPGAGEAATILRGAASEQQEGETIPQLQARLFPGVTVPEPGELALAMNDEIRSLWAAALLSGKYVKGQGALCNIARDNEGAKTYTYCCLGVLSELAILAGVDVQTEDNAASRTYDGSTGWLNYRIEGWAGLGTDSPSIDISLVRAAGLSPSSLSGNYYHSFAAVNDANERDVPFEHIAWLILGRPDLIVLPES